MLPEKEFWIGCQKGDLEKVKELSNQVDDINWRNQKNAYRTGMHIACLRGKEKVVAYLLTFPLILVNQQDRIFAAPIWIACESGREEVVRMLLRDKYERTPLWIACAKGKREVVKLLLIEGRGIEVN